MKRTNFLPALTCALLVFGLVGCGGSNNLQSITLGASLVNGQPPGSQAGFFTLEGNGGTIQLQATGTYGSGKTKDLTNKVTYTVSIDPVNTVDAFGNALLPPCAGPCQGGQGTLEFNTTGLITAVDPATCTWVDWAPDKNSVAWLYSGSYVVTASFGSVTSQPLYIPIASSGGNADNIFANPPIIGNNPSLLCGPTS